MEVCPDLYSGMQRNKNGRQHNRRPTDISYSF
jgi:hypothetical protein